MTNQIKTRTKILLPLFSVILTLLMLELIARFLLEPPMTAELVGLEPVLNDSDEELTVIELDERPDELYIETERGIRLRPNIKATIRNHDTSGKTVEIITNSLGFRNYELYEKGDSFRILVFGDSITFGDYVHDNETYVRQLESKLSKIYKNIQVINAGGAAVNLDSELALLLEKGISIDPDIVLIGLYLNDASEEYYFKISDYPSIVTESWFLSWLIKRLEIAYQFNLKEIDTIDDSWVEGFKQTHTISNSETYDVMTDEVFNKIIIDSRYDWGYAWSTRAWEHIGGIMKLIKDLGKEHDFKTVVILFPVSFQVENESVNDEAQNYFEETMKKLEIPHLDLLPYLREVYKNSENELYYDYCHFTPYGNGVVADIIAQFLIGEQIIEN